MTEKTKKWSDEVVSQLTGIVGTESPVSVKTLEDAAAAIGVSVRSVASKLRQMEYEVASTAKVHVSAFTEAEGAALKSFVEDNAGQYTYKEIAAKFASGKFNPKQIQGKVLALELTANVKPAEKVEVARTYTPAEEAKFVALVEDGAFIEEIAEALGKTVASVRGKALSLTRNGEISAIPKQKESHAKNEVDPIEALGAGIAELTVKEIAEKTEKTERGIKTALTRRGIKVNDYDGAAKKAKAAEKAKATK